ncbi:uncharacterized protein K460DRAFT_64719 [Cucurbitaria berberidis CBS 394.84]|uniref:Zn(2)-C6 fungal-type domain-containing protein n=1 Tax=Cucurbitaria berberidis CBS 394.84 TaxID=1168544 RepID=A0A9P4LAZ1_9PLEO|nr:uncharacterized protein K460DRAFT_64719 [Cucurbitaria berberidis CBS 394.84]KAF1847852.1 hypothetical protein K460DRAFT_64719 [Cucurbitaria berberidis CBS 394.84]
MATHKRTRTGCWTCREAGYKCDEQKPFCSRCTRLKIICKGYGVKLKWQDGTSTPAKLSRKSTRKRSVDQLSVSMSTPGSMVSRFSTPFSLSSPENAFSSPESTKSMPLLPAVSPGPSSDLSPGDRYLFHHWIDHLSTLISVAPRNANSTPFQLHLTSMAYDSAALRSTILSMAANHLGSLSNNSSLRLQAYRHQRDAIRELQQIIQEPGDRNHEPAFATVMMMQVSSRLFGVDDEANVANHLMGAKAMVACHKEEDWAASSSARFLMSLFAYHDILSSVSRGARPLVDHATDFTALEGEKDMESIANVLLVVARISELQQTIKRRRMESTETALSEEEDATGRVLQQILLNMDFKTSNHNGLSNETDVRNTAEAYRHAAFIYLYRTWLDIGAPNPISVDHVQRCLSYIEQVDVRSPLTTAHIWPLFTAGCEAVDNAQRQFVRARFGDMYTTKQFPSLKRVMRDIEDVWAAKDMEQLVQGQDGMAKVDCIQVILRRRGREVDLA